ncbi:dermonecrotic toxin domain-containing protein, partial [Pseudomonas tolaasii]
KAANARAWATQNDVDQRLKDLQALDTFAIARLERALLERHGLDLDVRATHLFLVIEKGGLLKGSRSRTLSMLDAALQNFARDETFT